MPLITKNDISGSRIVRIHSTYEDLEGCDCTTVYFTTNRGLSFTMPYPGHRWESAEIPSNAKELPDEFEEESYLVKNRWPFGRRLVRQKPRKNDLVKRMKQQSIVGVFYPKMDEDLGCYEPDAAFLLFDDGSRAYCTLVAPHGTGASGLHYIADHKDFEADEKLVDFFSVPLELDQRPSDNVHDKRPESGV